jgi:hypothetical protein
MTEGTVKLKRDEYAEAIFDALVPDGLTMVNLRLAIQRSLKRRFTKAHVAQMLACIRKRRVEYGFTVTPAKKGRAGEDGPPVLYATLVKKDGSFEIDDTVRQHFDAGALSSTATVTQMIVNLAGQLSAMAAQETSKPRRDDMLESADMLGFASRRMKRVLDGMREKDAA